MVARGVRAAGEPAVSVPFLWLLAVKAWARKVKRQKEAVVKEKLLKLVFARFLPHRTAIGVGLFVLAQVFGALNVPELCGIAPAVCAFAAKAQSILTPWLVIAGIRDQARK